jgi:hypothetical protein
MHPELPERQRHRSAMSRRRVEPLRRSLRCLLGPRR